MNKCKRCNRILKNLKSIELGFGSTCWNKCKPKKPEFKTLEDFGLW